jgi:hypothetical protein
MQMIQKLGMGFECSPALPALVIEMRSWLALSCKMQNLELEWWKVRLR